MSIFGKSAIVLLREFAASKPRVKAELTSSGRCASGTAVGELSFDSKTFKIAGAGMITFDAADVELESCSFDEELSKRAETIGEAALETALGLSFATVKLLDRSEVSLKTS